MWNGKKWGRRLPRHDFKCTACGTVLKDQYRTIQQGGSGSPPRCPACFTLMTWVVPRPAWDLRSDGEGQSGSSFQKFLARDGHNHLVEIDSLNKLRQVERESEQLARNGEGQVVRFRAYEQDRSNLSVNVFGERPADFEQPTAASKRRFGLQQGATHLDGTKAVPDVSFGPGVNDANCTALDDQ